ncbi:MAG TPA: DoxX family protein [Terriglobales bacterium]
MGRKIAYWTSTIIICVMTLFAVFSYLSGNQQAVQGFAHVGYPQQLRIILGIAKLLGVIALLAPGFPTLKEWAYAGFTFAWISAHIAHHAAHDPHLTQALPLILLALMFVSYFTRPVSRRWQPRAVVTT